MLNRLRRVSWRRALLLAAALPLTVLITATCVYYGELHLAARAQATEQVPELRPFTREDRVLVVAPHPDDETLGCGGLIERALAAGARVDVLLLTDGEAFEQSVDIEEQTLRPTSADYRTYALQRQRETVTGLGRLGLSREHVTFLNYPDRGLSTLWRRNWDEPYRPRTEGHTSQLPNALQPVGEVTGEGLVQAIARVLSERQPTEVFVTHPLDDHADHSLAACFVQAAMMRYQVTGGTAPELRYYVVHRGDWPLPQGYYPTLPLATPPGFDGGGTHRVDLDRREEQTKSAALDEYATQQRLLGRFMHTFVRRTELFYDAEPPPLIPKREIDPGDPQRTWGGLQPLCTEPSGDTLFRQVSAGLDIVGCYAAVDDDWLSLRFDFAGRVSRDGEYRVVVRGFSASGACIGSYDASLVPRHGHGGLYVHWRGNSLEWRIPRSQFPGMTTVAIETETHLFGLTYDRSGVVFASVPP